MRNRNKLTNGNSVISSTEEIEERTPEEQTVMIERQTSIIDYQTEQIRSLTEENQTLQTKLEKQAVQVVLVPMYKTSKQVNIDELHLFLVELSEPEYYINSDKMYDHYLLITKRGYEEELPPIQMPLNMGEGVEIVGQVANAWIIKIDDVHWERYGSIPVFIVAYSQADVDEFIAIAVDTKAMRTLMERVYASMYLNIKNKYNSYEVSLETEEKRREAAEERAAKVVDDFTVQLAEVNESAQEEMDKFAPRLTKKAMILLGAGWGVAVVLLGLLLGVLI